MKTIGLLGGMSWESTLPYYRLINEGIRARLGGLHSGKILLHSVDFDEVVQMQKAGDWDGAGRMLGSAAEGLKNAGAQGIMVCTNTMHKVAGMIEESCNLPLVHIADAVGNALKKDHVRRALLLGTRYTMEQDFYREMLSERYGIETVIPNDEEREEINRIIFEEICVGRLLTDSRDYFFNVINRFREDNTQAVIFGCTEIGLLVAAEQSSIPVFDSTVLHAEAGVKFMLAD